MDEQHRELRPKRIPVLIRVPNELFRFASATELFRWKRLDAVVFGDRKEPIVPCQVEEPECDDPVIVDQQGK